MGKKFLCAVVIFCLAVFWVGCAYGDDSEIRVGVLRFQSGVADVTSDQAAVIGDIFTRMLATSETLTVIGYGQLAEVASEHRIGISSGYVSPKVATQVGKLAECKYVVIGTVTDLKKKASSSGVWFVGSHKEEASTAADVRVVDVDSGETILSTSESGRASQSGSFVSIYGISSGQADISGMEAGAVSELSAKLSIKVRNAVGDPVTVTAASSKQVTLGIGTMGGAGKNSMFRIYTESRGKEQNIAVVKVTDAKSDYSKAVIADKTSGNLSLVRKGDKVYPIGSEELKDLVKRKSFVKSRPKESSSNADDDLEKMLNSSKRRK